MPVKLSDVVAWVPRIYPPKKVIPPELKLAILTRGRIRLPAATVDWFLEQSRLNSGTLPDRLTVPLSDIAPDYPVTVELFLNQRIHLGGAEIREALAGYLAIRRQRHLASSCLFLLFAWMTADRQGELEEALDLDIALVFRKAKVRITPRTDPRRYILLAYVCLPPEVARYLRPLPVPIPILPPAPPPLDPLVGRTNVNARVHLRAEPRLDADSLGVLAGVPVVFDAYDKVEADGHVWYCIQIREPLRVTPDTDSPLKDATFIQPQDTKLRKHWLAAIGVDFLVGEFDRLRNDVVQFESEHPDLNVLERITLLRQMLQNDNIQIDRVLGSPKGKVYRNTLPYVAGRWQLSKDYIVVRTPDDRWVEIFHILTSMDALWRREVQADINGQDIGTNWSASLWAGDIGSVAGEATARTLKKSWERWHPNATDVERVEHYMQSSAPDHELLGDIDGWGIINLLRTVQEANTIDQLLALYYTEPLTGSLRTLTAKRVDSLTRFVTHYGFNYHAATDHQNFPVLPSQQRPVARMRSEVYKFAKLWFWARYPYILLSNDPADHEPKYVRAVMQSWLIWLEYTCSEHGVDTG